MDLNTVRLILNSSQFRNYTLQQRRSLISKILEDGVSQQDLSALQDEMKTINQEAVHMFFVNVGGDAYLRWHEDDEDPHDLNHLWIIELDGVYIDELGLHTDIEKVGRNITLSMSVYKSFDEISSKFLRLESDIKYAAVEFLYFDYVLNETRALISDLKTVIGYTDVKPLFSEGDARVYLIILKGQQRILRIFSPEEGDASEIVRRYVQFSELELTPRVYMSGIFRTNSKISGSRISKPGKEYGYIVTDYIPITIEKITNKREQELAVRKAIEIGYRIESLGYFNQDNHSGNFLWDPKAQRVYAIDFGDLTTDEDGNMFPGEIRMLDSTD